MESNHDNANKSQDEDKPASPLVILFDLETTGLSVSKDEIVQLAALAVDDSASFQSFVLPVGEVGQKASEITGLTRSLLMERGAPDLSVVLEDFRSFLSAIARPKVLCAYNGCRFDFKILINALQRGGIDAGSFFDGCGVSGFWDPLEFVRSDKFDASVLPLSVKGYPSRKLGDVYKALMGTELDGAHDAMADCRGLRGLISHPVMKGAMHGVYSSGLWIDSMATMHSYF